MLNLLAIIVNMPSINEKWYATAAKSTLPQQLAEVSSLDLAVSTEPCDSFTYRSLHSFLHSQDAVCRGVPQRNKPRRAETTEVMKETPILCGPNPLWNGGRHLHDSWKLSSHS